LLLEEVPLTEPPGERPLVGPRRPEPVRHHLPNKVLGHRERLVRLPGGAVVGRAWDPELPMVRVEVLVVEPRRLELPRRPLLEREELPPVGREFTGRELAPVVDDQPPERGLRAAARLVDVPLVLEREPRISPGRQA